MKGSYTRLARLWLGLAALVAFPLPSAQAMHEGKLQVLLLGDSTTLGSICRAVQPNEPQLEDVIRLLLSAEKDLPPANIINQGRDGEYVYGLVSSGRYDREIVGLPGIDYIFIRFGINDNAKRENFAQNFPKDYHDLIGRLRRDFPQATIIPTTNIPYITPADDARINALIRQVAREQRLTLFDINPRYAAELTRGPTMLSYRRYPLDKIPEAQRQWVQPYVQKGRVVIMDNRLDAHFGALPGWSTDRHPNLAGYHVIGDETAKFLTRLIREKQGTPAPLGQRLSAR